MTHVEAIYQQGVFKPLGRVELSENQRVRLEIEPVEQPLTSDWLDSLRQMHQRFVEKHGFLPDSTTDIAADRVRDE
jgi:predicted DNA-binding antitoxin AbrB/MazE fold protein